MRLHRLELSAFLAFGERETIDFDRLGESGLFLLQGRTGAGKTSLLDAVCFAFYGDVPGARRDGGTLRSDHAAPGLATEVTLEATLRGRRIRVTRRPEQERPKQRGGGTTTDAHAVRVVTVEPDGSERVLATRHDDARAELGDLLGMTKEQFCQVVLLPQDGFARFLRARSDEREALLRELFDVGRFAAVEQWLRDRKMDAERTLGAAMREVRDVAGRVEEVGDAAAPDGWEADPERLASWLEEQLVVAEATASTAEGACTAADAARDAAAAELAAGIELAERQAAHAAARAAVDGWAAQAAERDRAAERLARARRAASAKACVDDLDARTRAEGAAESALARAAAEAAAVGVPESPATLPGFEAQRVEELRAFAREVRATAERAGAVRQREQEVQLEERALDLLRGRADLNAQNVRTYAGIAADLDRARAGLEAAAAEARNAAARLDGVAAARREAAARASAGDERDRLVSEHAAAREQHLAAREAAVAARAAHQDLQRRRLDGIAAELASQLVDGDPCAVCGATGHPRPAVAPDGGLTAEAAVRHAATSADAAEAARDDRAATVADVEAKLAGATALAGQDPLELLRERAERAAAEHDAVALAAAKLSEAERALVANETERTATGERLTAAEAALRESQVALRERIEVLERNRAEVDDARAGEPTIDARVGRLEALAAAADAAAEAQEDLEHARAEAGRARVAAADSARETGFEDVAALRAALLDPAGVADLEAEVRAHQEEGTRLAAAAAREELVAAAELPAPDVPALETAASTAREQADAARHVFTLSGHRLGKLRELRGRLTTAVAAAVPAREQHSVVREVADLAAGTSASNRLRMRLSAYVLAARLEEVAAAATLRLQRMSGGRYSLEHADDGAKGRSRGGLDLRVADAWTGRLRSPSSLSGGETFQASLALALGLADVVTAEAGGARLETLFVDEGFGSLDDEGTLDEVLDVLDGLRDGGRAVGIVSHVAELRQRIPTQLRVERGRSGSRVLAPA